MHNFRSLKVWEKSVELSVKTYQLTSCFPTDEKFGLISQMRRASVSIPSNIAEGAGRSSKKDFANFLGFATGSSNELETQMLIANKLKLVSDS